MHNYKADWQYYQTVNRSSNTEMTYEGFLEKLLDDKQFYNDWCRKDWTPDEDLDPPPADSYGC